MLISYDIKNLIYEIADIHDAVNIVKKVSKVIINPDDILQAGRFSGKKLIADVIPKFGNLYQRNLFNKLHNTNY